MSTVTLQKTQPEQPIVAVGFDNSASFAHIQRVAQMFSQSLLVPENFRGDQGLPNCVIALEMASRMGASALAIMQNIYIVYGKPGWSAQFITSAINTSRKFSPLRFTLERLGKKKVSYEYTVYGQNREKRREKGEVEIDDVRCVAWALDLTPQGGNERLESPPVTIELAVREGWYTKQDSKWRTMPELMLRYRAATFFGRLYAPEILMGMKTEDELRDVIDVDTTVSEPASKPKVQPSQPVALSLGKRSKKPAQTDTSSVATSVETTSQLSPFTSTDGSSSAKGAPDDDKPTEQETPKVLTPQEQICEVLTIAGVSLAEQFDWLKGSGWFQAVDTLGSMSELPTAAAEKVLAFNDTKYGTSVNRCISIFMNRDLRTDNELYAQVEHLLTDDAKRRLGRVK